MIIFVEGLSKSGKTFFIDEYLKKYDAIRFKGSGATNIGMMKRWQDYNFWMHNIIERLDELNSYKYPILWDRGLTDTVYSEDPYYSSELLRVIKAHKSKAVIFIDADKEVLSNRTSKDGHETETHHTRYLDIIKSFNTLTLKPEGKEQFITDKHLKDAHDFINIITHNQ